jgi:hypothetical protein
MVKKERVLFTSLLQKIFILRDAILKKIKNINIIIKNFASHSTSGLLNYLNDRKICYIHF